MKAESTTQYRDDYLRSHLSPIEDVLEDARNGRMFILIDAEDRENEGDLVIPAQMATPEVVNFMAKYGRGLICLTLSAERTRELQIPFMSQNNESRNRTAFTVSIEAREGITTGISAHDRARTIAVAIDPTKGKDDIVSPGHVFPLVAKDGGVLVRTGHTEAAVDIARLAGLFPAGVICEVMNDDGTMARAPDLIKVAEQHNLKIATIADLIAYRIKHDKLVRVAYEGAFNTVYGSDFRVVVYEDLVQNVEHFAIVKGDIKPDEDTLVRVHAADVAKDLLGQVGPRNTFLADTIKLIDKEGKGVIVIIRDVGSKSSFTTAPVDKPPPTESNPMSYDEHEIRNYGVGAQILRDLGVSVMTLISNTKNNKLIGVDGWSLKIKGTRPIPLPDTE